MCIPLNSLSCSALDYLYHIMISLIKCRLNMQRIKFLVCLHGEDNIHLFSFVESPRKLLLALMKIRAYGLNVLQ